MKIWVYPEYPVCMLAARLTGRPVKWVADRGESFISDTHGRDHVTRMQIAVDGDGRMRALRASLTANLGAYLSQFGPFIPTDAGAKMYNGVYAFEAVHVEVRGAYTNTVPVDAYRGAGRPEAAYAVERAVDATARDLGFDPAEFRRRNFIRARGDALPHRHGHHLRHGRVRASARGSPRARGRCGLRTTPASRPGPRASCAAWDSPTMSSSARAAATRVRGSRCCPKAGCALYIGTQSNGQGHATAYAQLLCDALGISPDQVETIQGDTDLVATGKGTGGSRSVPVGGVAVQRAAVSAVEAGKRIAADLLEAAEADLSFEDGRFRIVGTDRSVGLFEVAGQAGEQGLEGGGTFQPSIHTFPNGCHVCELDIDIATGMPSIVRYTIVDDFGTVLNPLLLAGQVHGGVVQGVGQALLEHAVYDASGQLVSGSFLDYTMPRAEGMPWIDFTTIAVPCTTNPLGMKGAGEAGAIGAPPAVINAVVDALGVRHVDMPATPRAAVAAGPGAPAG